MSDPCPHCPHCGDECHIVEHTNHRQCLACGWNDADDSVYQDEGDDFEPDGQPDEAQEWHDFDPDC